MSRGAIYWPHDSVGRPSGEQDDSVDDLLAAFEGPALTQFLEATDIHVQRTLIARLPTRTSENAELFDRVVDAARTSGDNYIRKRLAYELGESELIPCLPDRDASAHDAG
jgi:hypothetical protein